MADPDNNVSLDDFGESLFLRGAEDAAKRKQIVPPPQPPSPNPGEDPRHVAIRKALLEQAQLQYPALMNGIHTSYSDNLQAVQNRVNAELRSEGNRFHPEAVVLDPTKFDTGMALGLGSTVSVAVQLQQQGIQSKPDIIEDAGKRMSVGFATKFGATTTTQAPSALSNPLGVGQQACVIVPTSDHAMTADSNIGGLSTADRIKFLNTHETWHCRDDRFSYAGINMDEVKKVNPNDPKAIAASPDASRMVATNYQREAFADTGAIGSMLRDGYDMSLLDKVSAWRKERPADMLHITTPVLEGMKKDINAMGGLQKFRQMNEDQAKNFYYQVVNKYGVSGPAVQSALKYATGDGAERTGQQIGAIFDSDTSKGIDFYRYFNRPQGPLNDKPLSAQDVQALASYDPLKQMEERAFSTDGKVTPVTMVKAYAQIQEGLRAQMKAHPEEQLFAQEMIKLQKAFTEQVKTLDYVEVNKGFGVKIENVEPALAAFSDRPQQKGAPRTLSPAVKP